MDHAYKLKKDDDDFRISERNVQLLPTQLALRTRSVASRTLDPLMMQTRLRKSSTARLQKWGATEKKHYGEETRASKEGLLVRR